MIKSSIILQFLIFISFKYDPEPFTRVEKSEKQTSHKSIQVYSKKHVLKKSIFPFFLNAFLIRMQTLIRWINEKKNNKKYLINNISCIYKYNYSF